MAWHSLPQYDTDIASTSPAKKEGNTDVKVEILIYIKTSSDVCLLKIGGALSMSVVFQEGVAHSKSTVTPLHTSKPY